jgi:hypothetical protein
MGAATGFSSETGAAGDGLTSAVRPPSPPGSLFEYQQPGTKIRISADPSSARMPTDIGATAEPVLFFSISFSSFF